MNLLTINVNFAIIIESLLYVVFKLFNPIIDFVIAYFKVLAISLCLPSTMILLVFSIVTINSSINLILSSLLYPLYHLFAPDKIVLLSTNNLVDPGKISIANLSPSLICLIISKYY